jgi:hypothetical protein
MLIIEIHVDTVEETKPSTRKQRADEAPKPGAPKRGAPKRAKNKSKHTGNRFWKAINLNFPGSLIPQDKNER